MLKNTLLKQNPSTYCPVPDARSQAAMFNHPVIDGNILHGMASLALKNCHNKVKDFKTSQAYFDMVIKMKSVFYPEVQKTENVNYNLNVAQEIVDAIIDDKIKR